MHLKGKLGTPCLSVPVTLSELLHEMLLPHHFSDALHDSGIHVNGIPLKPCCPACRYEDYIFGTPAHVPVSERSTGRVKQAEQGVHRLKVYVALNDQSLNLQTDESYALIVSAPTSTLEVNTHYLSSCCRKGRRSIFDRVNVLVNEISSYIELL